MSGANYVGVWGWKNQHPWQRIINWTLSKPNSLQIVAYEDCDIKEIIPEEVLPPVIGFVVKK